MRPLASDLAALAEAWPRLPSSVRKHILKVACIDGME
jgi:hypothetical protein